MEKKKRIQHSSLAFGTQSELVLHQMNGLPDILSGKIESFRS
jgi:hypothetical protein